MSAMSTTATELRDWVTKLRTEIPTEFHHLLDEGHSILDKLLGEAESDATDLEQQAETAAAPVVAAAEADAGQLAHDAEADIEAAATSSGDKPAA